MVSSTWDRVKERVESVVSEPGDERQERGDMGYDGPIVGLQVRDLEGHHQDNRGIDP